jgi:hypothetical protein
MFQGIGITIRAAKREPRYPDLMPRFCGRIPSGCAQGNHPGKIAGRDFYVPSPVFTDGGHSSGAAGTRHSFALSLLAGSTGRLDEGLVNVRLNIFDVFETDREADIVLAHSGGFLFGRG